LRITPLDIRNHTFPRQLNGFDREEVEGFLRMVADDYEAALRSMEEARGKIRHLEERITDLAANETLLKETLTTAQHLSEDLKQTAMREAEVMVSEAEIQGEKILEAAHRRAASLAEDIREMKTLRSRMAGSLRSTIERHLSMLDHLTELPESEDADVQRRVSVLGRKSAERASGEG
jgi:cell division initiation protein